MRVRVDGKEVWTGDVGPEVRAFDGPIGVRSDNVEVIFQLNANVPDLAGHPVAACPNGPVEEE